MFYNMWLLLFLLIPAHAQEPTPQNLSSACLDQNHIFFVPGVLSSGGSSRACLSRFHADGQARMTITLVTEEGVRVTATRDLAPGDGGCLDLSVPQKPNTKADVNVNVRYIDDNCIWTQRVSVRIAASKLLVVHTERARYRPGELLRFRVLALKTDLTPVSTAIEEVWLEGPGTWNVKAAQWNRVRTRTGLVQLQHELDEIAPPGKWTLRARLDDGSQGSATFSVGNYELPPFQLTVRHSPKVLRTSERLSWTVCVRYPWSEAVEGMLVIRIRGAGSSAGIRTAVRLRARACHRHAAAARRIQLDKMAADDVVIADFSFQEEGTRVWQNTTVVSQVVENPVTLEFLTKHKPIISPGLPYKLKIKATRWDDKPAARELIHVCRSPAASADARVTAACVDGLTDDSGVARITFTVEQHASPYYIFEASARNTHIRLVTHSAVGGARAAFGPLRAARTRSILPLYLQLPAHNTSPVTVHFIVVTRGGTIYRWGATTQCPTSDSDQIHTTTRNSVCPSIEKIPRKSNLVTTNSSDLDSLLDFHAAKIMLPLKMSHQMCPDSYLFAYFQYNGDLVTASKHFEMEECFTSEVQLSWSSRITPPGSAATLTVSTAGPALCALSAIDSAAKWTSPPHELKEEVMYQLKRAIQTQRNVTQYDAAGDCFLTSDEPFEDSSELSASGVRSVGAGPPPRCIRAPQALTEEVRTRTDFAEAWLWRLLPVGSNGTGVATAVTPDSVTRYEASAFCLSKSGVALAQPAVLQVFREFFIHADGPKRLRRGDTTMMRYRLFNYLYEPLSVQVTVSSDQALDVLERAEWLCVRARSSVARRLTVVARQLGDGSLKIRAESRPGACSNDTTPASGDEVEIKVYVEPEGVPTYDYKSALLCANTGFGTSADTWRWPAVPAAPGSERLTVWVTGDLNGPLLADADSLVLLPRGCGEQNMQRLAANYLAMMLQAPAASNAVTTRLHVARGLVRQMQYLHPSGGFSAFGASDPVPSTWLTAFCVRYLRRIHQALYPDTPVPDFINRAERWLIEQQMENGCFRNEGQIFHRELRGGIDEEGEVASVALTAYTIASLMESTTVLPHRVVRNSISCFRALPPVKSKTSPKIYAHALLAYTLMRLRRYEEDLGRTNEASPVREEASALKDSEETRELVDLIRMARRSGEFVWWDSGNLATSIEATGYALLALAECPGALQPTCAADARAGLLWLSTHRTAGGGFLSTQDTLVALEAMGRWSNILPPPTSLRVRIQNAHTTETVNIAPGISIPNIIKMDASEKLSVTVEGTGCALVQATRSYSGAGGSSRALAADVTVVTAGPFNCDDTSCYCAAVVDVCVVWRGALPAMSLAEVSLPAGYGADARPLYAQLDKQDSLLRRIELSTSGGKATLYLGTRDGADNMPRAGHECFRIHAVGPRAKTKPGYARVYDYYHPEVADTQTFTIPEDCPAPINDGSQRKPKYSSTDNLFNSAKSPDGDEILIIDDFEDVPEGIPLDYPTYDNIIKEEKPNTSSKANVTVAENTELFNNNKETILESDAKNPNETIQFDESSKMIKNPTANGNTSVIDKDIDTTSKTADDALNEVIKTNTSIKQDSGKLLNNTIQDNIDIIGESNKEETSDMNEYYKEKAKTDIKEEIKDMSESNKEKVKVDVEGQHNQVNEVNEKRNQDIVSTDAPHLTNFHDVNYDLEVPSGLEGPVPSIVLPPKDFFVQSDQPLQRPRQFEPLFVPNYVYINQDFIAR